MRRISLFLTTFILALSNVIAQVSFKIQAPAQAEAGQRIRVSYVANTTDIEDFQIGDFQGFRVLYGPSTSQSSSFSMTNGRTTQSSTMTFTYTVAAESQGTFKLPAATIVVNGKSYKSNTSSIEILPASQHSQAQQGNQGQQGAQGGNSRQQRQSPGANGQISDKDLYMTVTASKHKIFEQEAVLLTYKLYTLVNIQQIAGEMPQLDGFHVQEVDSKAQLSLKYENVNGRNYGTAVWKQYVLFPQKTGKISVPSISFDAQVEVQNRSMDPFDIFFGGGSLMQMVRKQIKAPAIDIEVMPLPTPKPSNFSGAVGSFTVSASLTPEQINANDAATLRLVVSGQGNMKLMKSPKVNFPQDFEVYDPKSNDKTTNTATGAKGNVIYDYVVVPRHGGKFNISPVEFCYFDPAKSEYITLRTDSFSLAVAKPKGGGSAHVIREQEDLNVIGDDIHFIKLSQFNSRDDSNTFFGTNGYWLTHAVMLFVFVAVMLYFRRRIKQNANVWKSRGRKAGKAASKRLKKANSLMKQADSAAFYDEVMRALLGYAGDKLSLPNAELNKDNVVEKLKQRGVDEALVNDYIHVLSECEFARYAPGSDQNIAKENLFRGASEAINKLDAAISK